MQLFDNSLHNRRNLANYSGQALGSYVSKK